MGTSSSYKGPIGGNQLLPSWAQDEVETPIDGDTGDDFPRDDGSPPTNELDSEKQPSFVRMPSWKTPKSDMRRLVKQETTLSKVAKSYVRAKGGAKMASQTAVSGRRYAVKFGGFLSDIARQGIQFAVQRLGLHTVVGSSAEEVFVAITQALCPPGETLEEHIARVATNEAWANLVERYGGIDNIETLDHMDESAIRDALKDYVQSYIYQRWLQELGDRLESTANTAEEAVRLERDVRDYVRAAVDLDLSNFNVLQDDWSSQQLQDTIQSIFQDAYNMLEG